MLEATIKGALREDLTATPDGVLAATLETHPGRTMRRDAEPALVHLQWRAADPEAARLALPAGTPVVVTGELELVRPDGSPHAVMLLHADDVVRASSPRNHLLQVSLVGKVRGGHRFFPDREGRWGVGVVNFEVLVFNARRPREPMTVHCQLWGGDAQRVAETTQRSDRLALTGDLWPALFTHSETRREHTTYEMLVRRWRYAFDKGEGRHRERGRKSLPPGAPLAQRRGTPPT